MLTVGAPGAATLNTTSKNSPTKINGVGRFCELLTNIKAVFKSKPTSRDVGLAI